MAVRRQFNTAIASIMELLNFYGKVSFDTKTSQELAQEILEAVVIMLSPIIPHICEELFGQLVPGSTLLEQQWVKVDQRALEVDEVEIIIQVNGKLRGKITVDKSLSKEQVEEIARQNPNVAKFIEGQTIKKTIVVPGKLVNIVV